MELRDMTEDELNEFLFAFYAEAISAEEARERFEMEIELARQWLKADEDEVVISPGWVHFVLCRRAHDEMARMSESELNEQLDWAHERFLSNRRNKPKSN